jgi:hypothetical protein
LTCAFSVVEEDFVEALAVRTTATILLEARSGTVRTDRFALGCGASRTRAQAPASPGRQPLTPRLAPRGLHRPVGASFVERGDRPTSTWRAPGRCGWRRCRTPRTRGVITRAGSNGCRCIRSMQTVPRPRSLWGGNRRQMSGKPESGVTASRQRTSQGDTEG